METMVDDRLRNMKQFTAFFLALFTMTLYSYSQPLIQTPRDAYKLKNDSSFRGKPLKTLLKEIGPEIKMVFVGNVSWEEGLAYLNFYFEDWLDKSKERQRCTGGYPLRIRVMIKESFDWKKPQEDKFKWTQTDAERLANLTIAYIRVSGDVDPEGYVL